MTTPQLRSTALRLAMQSKRKMASVAKASMSTNANMQQLISEGVLCDKGLVNFDTLHELHVNSCKTFASSPLFGTYSQETKAFQWETYKTFQEQVTKTRAVLKDIGVSEYSKIGIISNNRWEWAAIASAAYGMNATIVPMYEAQLASDWTYILNDSGSTTLFCASDQIYEKLKKEVLPCTPMVQATLCLDAPLGQGHSFKTAMENVDLSSSTLRSPTIDDLADLIYTSGTTGKPKGVELTHNNICTNVKSAVRSMVSNPDVFLSTQDVSLAFLPWAHSYGQTCELWAGMSQGTSMGICRGVPSILEDLQLVKPSILFAVPTLYKRIYDGVNNLIETSPPARKKLMRKALEMGRKKAKADHGIRPSLGLWEQLQFKVLDSLVLSKIRDRFGGNMRHGFVAGAACPAEVLEFMDDLGIPICEGYGLTETSPIITINTPENRRVGSVGCAIGGVDVFIIGEDGQPVEPGMEGEICCVGPNIMRSYYKNQAATDEVISVAPDGKGRMFHTGDLGRVDADGFVRVTGRLKEQYKLENGKYVVPTPIEEAIGMSRFISQNVLCGANRPHNVILIVPDFVAIRNELKIDPNVSEEELASDARVKELIDKEIASNSCNLKKFEIPTKWAFVAPFTAANNMLTPKMSIRRHKVIDTYDMLISRLYNGDDVVTEAADGGHHVKHAA